MYVCKYSCVFYRDLVSGQKLPCSDTINTIIYLIKIVAQCSELITTKWQSPG